MNNLSWILYWADAAPAVSRFIAILGFMIFVASLFLGLLGWTGFFGDEVKAKKSDEAGGNVYDFDRYGYSLEMAPRFRKLWPITLIAFLLWGGSFLVPSKDTFYMIAASEAGEQAIQTPEFTKVRGVLNKWLDDQIKSDEDPATKEESK